MTAKKEDILDMNDIHLLVDTFYSRIREHAVLGPIFDEKIQDRWSEHLEKMHRFWQTVLLEEHTYFGSPFLPHAQLPIQWVHFEQWIGLFTATVDELFEGPRAEKAKWQGQRMAEMFHAKINYYRENTQARPLL